jgi:hypothetical protein
LYSSSYVPFFQETNFRVTGSCFSSDAGWLACADALPLGLLLGAALPDAEEPALLPLLPPEQAAKAKELISAILTIPIIERFFVTSVFLPNKC